MRVRGTSTKELSEAGEDTEGLVTNKSKLRTKVKAITGIDILADSGNFKSTYQILTEIANVWKDISDTDQAALLEVLAGECLASYIWKHIYKYTSNCRNPLKLYFHNNPERRL